MRRRTRVQYGPLQHWLWPYSTADYPAAGLTTTADDLLRLFAAIDAGHVLSRGSLERMWTRATLNDGKRPGYALGWTVSEIDGARAVGHEGGGCCWVTHLPEKHITVIALCNLAGSRADATARDIASIAMRTAK